MSGTLKSVAVGSAMALLLVACGPAKDIKDAADGIRSVGKDSEALQARLDRSKGLTFTATYEVKGASGAVEEVVIAQSPPKSSYRQGDTQLIDDGKRIYSCSKDDNGSGTKTTQCLDIGAHSEDGIYGAGAGVGFGLAFSPVAFIALYSAAAIIPGVEAGKSTRDIAGQSSECVSIKVTRGSDKGSAFEGCTTDDGVLSYSDSGDGKEAVTLKKFEKRADNAAFTPPAKPRTPEQLLEDSTSTTTP